MLNIKKKKKKYKKWENGLCNQLKVMAFACQKVMFIWSVVMQVVNFMQTWLMRWVYSHKEVSSDAKLKHNGINKRKAPATTRSIERQLCRLSTKTGSVSKHNLFCIYSYSFNSLWFTQLVCGLYLRSLCDLKDEGLKAKLRGGWFEFRNVVHLAHRNRNAQPPRPVHIKKRQHPNSHSSACYCSSSG